MHKREGDTDIIFKKYAALHIVYTDGREERNSKGSIEADYQGKIQRR